ncbi:hypothetical protein [Nonomuraea dietziae]|uniref:hypothetical protein n=1 Tax=Nonomuraea dietziae TaxID=65515 RepID=UPI0033D04CDF
MNAETVLGGFGPAVAGNRATPSGYETAMPKRMAGSNADGKRPLISRNQKSDIHGDRLREWMDQPGGMGRGNHVHP